MRLAGLTAVVVLVSGCGLAAAQGAQVARVRVARLTYVEGAVQVVRADNTGADEPVLNMPLVMGNRVVTGDYGQAEIEFEDGSVARLTPRSALALDDLSVSQGTGDAGGMAVTRLVLLNGLAYFELRKAPSFAYTVDAGGTRASLIENAVLRVAFDEPPATFAVLSGSVRVERPEGFRSEVHSGESLRADKNDETRYFLNQQVTEESWDRWNEARDEIAENDGERRTMARDGFAGNQGYGWSDLDTHGRWYEVAGQGMVWQPDVADEGFDPYGYGSWVWVNTGYVWASGYNWGWTPYRCGRWSYFGGFGWGWTPAADCGYWGGEERGGGTYVAVGGRPPERHAPVQVPVAGPGKVHPILKVTGPDGPRPRGAGPGLPGNFNRGGPVKVGGLVAMPLEAVKTRWRRPERPLGQTLARDFPVDAKTHVAILGAVPIDRPVAAGTPQRAGWQQGEGKPRQSAPVTAGRVGVRSGSRADRSADGLPTTERRSGPVVAAPAVKTLEVPAKSVVPMPVIRPANPVMVAPVQMHTQAPPAAISAPAKTESAPQLKPKG